MSSAHPLARGHGVAWRGVPRFARPVPCSSPCTSLGPSSDHLRPATGGCGEPTCLAAQGAGCWHQSTWRCQAGNTGWRGNLRTARRGCSVGSARGGGPAGAPVVNVDAVHALVAHAELGAHDELVHL